MAESFQKTYTAEMIIDEIRNELVEKCESYFGCGRERIAMDKAKTLDLMANALGFLINTINLRSIEKCEGLKNELPNVGIAIIKGRNLSCVFLRKIVFVLLSELPCTVLFDGGSQRYLLHTNNSEPLAFPKDAKSATEQYDPTSIFQYRVELEDIRFFMFTTESVRALQENIPPYTLFTRSPGELTWILYEWQRRMYEVDPFNVPTAGFLLVDNLQKMIRNLSPPPAPPAPPEDIRRQWEKPWFLPPVLSSTQAPKLYANQLDKKLSEFQHLTKELYKIHRKLREEIGMCKLWMQNVQDSKERKLSVLPGALLKQMKRYLNSSLKRLNYVDGRIRTLMTCVQYELYPALEALFQENSDLSKKVCRNWKNTRLFHSKLERYNEMIYRPIKQLLMNCECHLGLTFRMGLMVNEMLRNRAAVVEEIVILKERELKSSDGSAKKKN